MSGLAFLKYEAAAATSSTEVLGCRPGKIRIALPSGEGRVASAIGRVAALPNEPEGEARWPFW